MPTFGEYPISMIRPQDVRHWQAKIRREIRERLALKVARGRKDAEAALAEAADRERIAAEAVVLNQWVKRTRLRADQARSRADRAVALVDRLELAAGRQGEVRVAHAYRLIRTILNQAVDEDRLLEENPCRIKKGGKAESPERPRLSRLHMEALAGAMPPEMYALIVTTYYAHLRLGEMLALKWRDIDFERGLVRIHRAASTSEGKRIEKKTKTGNVREVRLPTQAMEVLRQHQAEAGPALPTAPVFRHRSGGELRDYHVNAAWKRAKEATGLTQFHFHDLRHGGLTLVAQYGAPVRHIQARAGHKTTAAAMNYQHIAEELELDLAARMSDPELPEDGQASGWWLRSGFEREHHPAALLATRPPGTQTPR